MQKAKCSVEGCDSLSVKKGMCDPHYRSTLKYGSPQEKRVIRDICTVEGCGEEHYALGYCNRHYNQYKRGKPLTPRKESRACSVEGCKEKHYASGLCSRHYYQKRNKEQRPYLTLLQRKYNKTEKQKISVKRYLSSEKGRAATSKGRHTRRAREKGAAIEKFSCFSIYERDYYICSLCGLPIDKELRYPNPLSVTLEHTIPLSKGGEHSAQNVTCAHLICNVRRGNRPLKNNFDGASI